MDNNNQNRNSGKKPNSQNIGVMVLILMITLGVVSMMNSALKQNQTQELGYEEFVQMVEDGEVDTIRFSGNRILITPKTSSTKYSRLIQYYGSGSGREGDGPAAGKGCAYSGRGYQRGSQHFKLHYGLGAAVGANDRAFVFYVQPYGGRRRPHGG